MSEDDKLLSNLWDWLKSAIAFFIVFRFALSVFISIVLAIVVGAVHSWGFRMLGTRALMTLRLPANFLTVAPLWLLWTSLTLYVVTVVTRERTESIGQALLGGVVMMIVRGTIQGVVDFFGRLFGGDA